MPSQTATTGPKRRGSTAVELAGAFLTGCFVGAGIGLLATLVYFLFWTFLAL